MEKIDTCNQASKKYKIYILYIRNMLECLHPSKGLFGPIWNVGEVVGVDVDDLLLPSTINMIRGKRKHYQWNIMASIDRSKIKI